VSRHVLEADEAYRIGPGEPAESYLNIQRIVAVAKKTGAEGVHPGYGFLAENPEFARACDEAVITAMSSLPPGPVALEGLYTALEHEAMHQETLLYMWHRLPLEDKRRPVDEVRRANLTGSAERPGSAPGLPRQEWVEIPGGRATLGVNRDELVFGWDNEFPRHVADVGAFAIDRFNVTNAQFMEFVEAGGYRDRRWWREED